MIQDAIPARHVPAEPHPDSRLSAFAQGVRSMSGELQAEVRDITRMNVPLLKAIGVFLFVGSLVWWARGLQSSVEGMARDLSGLSTKVGEVLDMKSDLASARGEINTMERELSSLREDYKVLELKYERLDKDFAVATARKGE